jgi:hypothetical protein
LNDYRRFLDLEKGRDARDLIKEVSAVVEELDAELGRSSKK